MSAMEVNFFKNVENLKIKGGHFAVNNGPNTGQKVIHNQRNTTINDHSQRTTNYGHYRNYGQHAESNGQINNYGTPPSNPGAGYGKQRNPWYNPEMDNWSPPSSDDDNNFNVNYQPPPPGQSPYRGPDRSAPRSRDPTGRYPPASQSEAQIGSKRPREAGLPRANTERPDYPTRGFHPTSPDFQSEYDTMSPKMKEYLKSLGHGPRGSLNEGMANMRLENPSPQGFGSPGNYGRPIPDVARKGVRHPASPDSSDEGQSEEDEDDYDAGNGNLAQRPSPYVHNDNRVITTNINSHNVNTENVVDSYNDNSTRTDIRKGGAQ